MKIAWLLIFTALQAPAQTPELWIDLSGEWDIRFGDPVVGREGPAGTIRLPLQNPAWFGTRRGDDRQAWLSKTVALPAWADRTGLSLTLGALEDVYEVFVNGQRIGATGAWDSYEQAQTARARTFDIPGTAVGEATELRIALHLRRALAQPGWLRLPDTGPYTLTSAAVAPRHTARDQAAQRLLLNTPRLIFNTWLAGLALLALAAWRMEPSRWELPWFAAACANASLNTAVGAWMLSGSARPYSASGLPVWEMTTSILRLPLLAGFAAAALDLRSPVVRGVVWLGIILLPTLVATVASPVSLVGIYTAAVLTILGTEWWRNRSGLALEDHLLRLVLALPLVQRAAATYINWRSVYLDPFRFDLEDAGLAATSALTLALLFRRFARDRREKERLAGELEAARAVQQLLLPGADDPDGFEVHAVYEPAQEVGGDFHWRAVTPDGLVVVVGDVSGKGLKAAMLVSVAVGLLRAAKTSSPAGVLVALNEGLSGHTGGAFVTCCCARFDAAGAVTVASAGHPAPYADGVEMELDSGLPLGVAAGAVYPETTVTCAGLTLVSDGVLEAARPGGGELFGFDRTREISTQSAREIAEAAKQWGQNDDITVVTVRRTRA